MQQTKHTPGPWKKGIESIILVGEYTAISAGDYGIAILTCNGISEDQTIANAILIKSAPELLALLKDIRTGIELGFPPEKNSITHELICKIITKAEGVE